MSYFSSCWLYAKVGIRLSACFIVKLGIPSTFWHTLVSASLRRIGDFSQDYPFLDVCKPIVQYSNVRSKFSFILEYYSYFLRFATFLTVKCHILNYDSRFFCFCEETLCYFKLICLEKLNFTVLMLLVPPYKMLNSYPQEVSVNIINIWLCFWLDAVGSLNWRRDHMILWCANKTEWNDHMKSIPWMALLLKFLSLNIIY